MLDALLAAEELPEEYRERCQVNTFFCVDFMEKEKEFWHFS